jgi:hypothetical protein
MPDVVPHPDARARNSVVHKPLPWWSAELAAIFAKGKRHMCIVDSSYTMHTSMEPTELEKFQTPPSSTPLWMVRQDLGG